MKRLVEILKVPSVSLVVGKRGSGKTAFGTLLLEEAHEAGMKTYLLGLPKSKQHLLPEWIELTDNIAHISDNSAIFMDESYIYAYARDYPKELNKFMAKIVGVSRQKRWLLLFSSHTARKLDIGVVLDVDNLIVREPSWLHIRYERAELRELIEKAAAYFSKCKEPVKYAYIYTEKGPIVAKLNLPSFWTEELSLAFSGAGIEEIF